MILAVATIICISSVFLPFSKAVLSLEVDEDIHECDNGKPMAGFDADDLNIIAEADGSITLNGSVTFLKDYGNPTSWKLTTKRLERGEWRAGIVSRYVPNVCPIMQMPTEPWYPYTRLMKQKTCPYLAGHKEYADNVNIGNYATLFNVPPDFIGEWRVYYEVTTLRGGAYEDECALLQISVNEA